MSAAGVAGLALMAGVCLAAGGDVEAVFGPITAANAPGAAVWITRQGKTVFERGYNLRDLRTRAHIDSKTNFRLASCTKQFTAAGIMLLARDGKLRYDQKLTEIFSDFPAYGRDITIRNLLTHTSGLPDYEDLMQGGTWTAEHQIQDGEVLQLLKQQTKGRFAAGASWSYSNSGYVVLGLIAAKVSGEPLDVYLRRRIFEPLEMGRTVVYVKGKNTIPDRAYGHSKEGGQFTETDQSSTSATLGDGGIYSNLEDLAKWDRALKSHKLLSEAEMRPALTPVKLNDGSQTYWPKADGNDDNLHPGRPVSYGFGWFLDPLDEHPRMWHTGSSMGFRTVIERFTADQVTIIILSNRTDLDPEKLAIEAYRALKQ